MNEMISMCGLNCHECPTYIATQKDDDNLRKKVIEDWGKMMQMDLKTEDINCDGCLSKEGKFFAHCKNCAIRSCGTEKSIENCALCSEYSCDKLNSFLDKFLPPDARSKLEGIRKGV